MRNRNTSGLKRGGSKGRPKGTPNKATREAREFCAGIVCDPEYQRRIKARALAGKLSPQMEALLWHYAHGKPTQLVQQVGDFQIRWADTTVAREEGLGSAL